MVNRRRLQKSRKETAGARAKKQSVLPVPTSLLCSHVELQQYLTLIYPGFQSPPTPLSMNLMVSLVPSAILILDPNIRNSWFSHFQIARLPLRFCDFLFCFDRDPRLNVLLLLSSCCASSFLIQISSFQLECLWSKTQCPQLLLGWPQ